MQYGLIDSECMHSICHFQDNDDEFVDNIMKYPPAGFTTFHTIVLFWLQKGS